MISEGETCVCQKCNQTFSCISLLRRHTKNEHRNETVPYHIIRTDQEGSPEAGLIDNRLDNPSGFNTMQQSDIQPTNHSTVPTSCDESLANENSVSVSRDTPTSRLPENTGEEQRSLSHQDPLNLLLDMPVPSTPATNIEQDQSSNQQTVQSYIETFSKNLEHLSVPKSEERKLSGMSSPSMMCTSELDQYKDVQYLQPLSGHQCSECGHYLESHTILEEHLTSAHQRLIKSYPCLYCNNVFFSPHSILEHLKSVLTSPKPSPMHLIGIKKCSRHICPICEVVHVSAFKLKHHLMKNKCEADPPPFQCDDIMSSKLECMKLALKSYRPKRKISQQMYSEELQSIEQKQAALEPPEPPTPTQITTPKSAAPKPLPNVASRPSKAKKLRHPTQTRSPTDDHQQQREQQQREQQQREQQQREQQQREQQQREQQQREQQQREQQQREQQQREEEVEVETETSQPPLSRNQYLIAQPLHYLGPNPTPGCASNTPFISQFRHPQYITYNMDNFLYHPQHHIQVNIGQHYLASQQNLVSQQDQQTRQQFNPFASLHASAPQNHSAVKLARSTTQPSLDSPLLQIQQHTSDKEHSCIGCNRKYPTFEALVQHCRETGCPDIM